MVDLRKAKSGDVYIDGTGNKVRILCTDRKDDKSSNFNVVGLRECHNIEEVETYTLDGSYFGKLDPDFKRYDLVKLLDE